MSSKNRFTFANKIETYDLKLTSVVLIPEQIKEWTSQNPDLSFFINGVRTFMKDEYPETLSQLDNLFRTHFKIPDKNKLILSYIPPPSQEDKSKSALIKGTNFNVLRRVVFCSVDEFPVISYGNITSETLHMKKNVAYSPPVMTGGLVSFDFSNSKKIALPKKAGHRQSCRCVSCRKGGIPQFKNIENRHIYQFDYMMTKEDTDKLLEGMGLSLKDSSGNTSGNPEDESLLDELNELSEM